MIMDVNNGEESNVIVQHTVQVPFAPASGTKKYKWMGYLKMCLLSLKKKNDHIWREYNLPLGKKNDMARNYTKQEIQIHGISLKWT